jgi:hypothetical protein
MKKLLLMSLFVIGSLNLNANVSEKVVLTLQDCVAYGNAAASAELDSYGWFTKAILIHEGYYFPLSAEWREVCENHNQNDGELLLPIFL